MGEGNEFDDEYPFVDSSHIIFTPTVEHMPEIARKLAAERDAMSPEERAEHETKIDGFRVSDCARGHGSLHGRHQTSDAISKRRLARPSSHRLAAPASPSPLLDEYLAAVESMVRKGRFWGDSVGDADLAAVGFVATLGDILVRADQAGLVDMWAMADEANIDAALGTRKSVPSGARTTMQNAAALQRRFARGDDA